jgi:multiple sugar transport system permease protein
MVETRAAWAFLSPDLAGLALFIVLPILLAFGMAFMSVSGFGAVSFVGIENFARLLSDDKLPKALIVTFTYAILAVPLSYVVGLGLALLLEGKVRGGGLVRTMVFIPYVLSLVVVALIWQFMLVDKTGVVPTILRGVNLGHVSWLGDPKLALLTVVGITVWSQAGYQMLLFLGGLGGIPKDYYDAAAIDGAGWWRKLFSITLPMLRPTSFFILLTSAMACITGVQAFDLIFMLTRGGPADATLTMPFYIYEQAFTYNDLGYASALTLVLVAILMVAVVATFAFTKGARFHEGD